MPSRRSSPAPTTRRALLAGTAGLAAAAGAAAAQPARRGAARAPNIVLMMVDNFGYGDLGCYGGGELRGAPTPRIDALAAEGLRLTNFNVEPECTPSRSALLTGRMPIRTGTSIVESRGLKDGIAPWEYTLAELLSDAGYATACYGKWHLGSSDERAPTRQGFDEWFGIPRSSGEVNWPLQPGFDPREYTLQSIMEGRRGEPSRPLRTYDRAARPLIDREITERAEAYIRRQSRADRPFFLYLPFTLPHEPPLAHPDFVKPGRSNHQNALVEIDHNAGRVIDAVDKAGLKDDTIVIFCSENGPQSFQGIGVDFGGRSDTGPFRGEFPSGWEGAIRTPCVIRWPGRAQAGRVSNQMVSIQDFYRTFANLAGASGRVPTDRAVDSIDQTDFLFGGKAASNREHLMIFHNNRLLAVKWKNFKMHFAVREPPRGAVVASGQAVTTSYLEELPSPWVFDLENDPKELWNIYTTNIWVRRPIARIQREYEESVARFPNVPTGGEGPVRPAGASA
ncbi:MAG: arylsulfatase [Phenylobacterium sp.]|uniref:arylsulfatase n=1 Tax=Phenylobacterium sp. TaxID=1871053 RepID=UPI001A607D5C|nr:arylsulfatase [Phenylobacterium sp.]MBL8773985.1 arylsulfatase [Phenylobacterium sp.]